MASAASARSSVRSGLALIVGSSNYLKPDVPLPQIPTAFLYLGCWFLMAGVVYYFFGIETRGKSIEQIDKELGVDGLTALPRLKEELALDTLIPTSADLAGDPAVISRAEALRPGGRGGFGRDRGQRAGCRRRCSTNCTRRSCSACCCRARRTGSRPIPSPSSMSSRPSPAPTPRTAWCLSQAGGCAMSAAYLDLPVAQEIFGNDPRAVLAWGPGPKVEGDRVRGRLQGHRRLGLRLGRPARDLARRALPDLPGRRLAAARRRRPAASSAPCWCRASDVAWTDIWNTVGLRGTASDQFALTDHFVRADHSITARLRIGRNAASPARSTACRR